MKRVSGPRNRGTQSTETLAGLSRFGGGWLKV